MLKLTEVIRRRIVELLQALVRIPSENPPGNEGHIASFAQEYLEAAGIAVCKVPLETEGVQSLRGFREKVQEASCYVAILTP